MKMIFSFRRRFNKMFRLFGWHTVEEEYDFILIHIGKCGGSTVIKHLAEEGYKFKIIHLEKVVYHPKDRYVIIIRNPVDRFVSAFNWRYKLVVNEGTQHSRFKGEKVLLQKFGSANLLGESLYDSDGKVQINFQEDDFYIHHLKEDISFYIKDLVSRCKKENILAVITLENLKEDMKEYFNIDLKYHLKKNENQVAISKTARDNLVKYYHDDYNCIKELQKLDVLNEKQHEILTRK